jgi:hypothetical protein
MLCRPFELRILADEAPVAAAHDHRFDSVQAPRSALSYGDGIVDINVGCSRHVALGIPTVKVRSSRIIVFICRKIGHGLTGVRR